MAQSIRNYFEQAASEMGQLFYLKNIPILFMEIVIKKRKFFNR